MHGFGGLFGLPRQFVELGQRVGGGVGSHIGSDDTGRQDEYRQEGGDETMGWRSHAVDHGADTRGHAASCIVLHQICQSWVPSFWLKGPIEIAATPIAAATNARMNRGILMTSS
ncbi:hypothetical protein GCM10009856_38810 [Mycolicibacterium llatzerense]